MGHLCVCWHREMEAYRAFNFIALKTPAHYRKAQRVGSGDVRSVSSLMALPERLPSALALNQTTVRQESLN